MFRFIPKDLVLPVGGSHCVIDHKAYKLLHRILVHCLAEYLEVWKYITGIVII
jgi:hypothetical protein